jgi:ParB-like chromosome segregation protein Spo0J
MNLIERFEDLTKELSTLELDERVDVINAVRLALHEASPFRNEPVDYVRWVRNDQVIANDYNPNSVAPPEMELLRVSIQADGYTQPIVSMPMGDGRSEVVDGFHRHRVGKECEDVHARIHGDLPVVSIREEQYDKTKRMASTIRHNRARGKHKVEAMSDIVIELKRRNWTDDRICRELGMDPDEVLRLCQISGLQELFSDQEFSKSWDVEGEVLESDFVELSDDVSTYGEETSEFRAVNTSDEGRVFHTYEVWECHKAGFYATTAPEGMKKADCEEAYRAFLSDIPRFSQALEGVISEWKNSCEHYLTNAAMNRIAWLGQAAMCYATGIPSQFRSGFFLLTEAEQSAANEAALVALNKWLIANGREAVDMTTAYGGDRQSDIY